MSITKDVLTIIRNNPNITAGEIQECARISIPTAKAILWRLVESGKVTRIKVKRPALKGPQSVFAYSVKENDAQQITSSSTANGRSESLERICEESRSAAISG